MGFARAIGLACLLATAAPAVADAPLVDPAPDPSETETFGYDEARDDRMTIAVSIGGDGPYRFIIDTGSERTVISRELADSLALVASDDVMLSSVLDIRRVPTVVIPELGFGRQTMEEVQAPALARRNIGAHGVLGIDALEDHQVVLDFGQREMTLTRSRYSDRRSSDNNVIVVRGRTRLGRLVLADARIDGTRILAIVDTGSSFSIGNMALRDRLVRRGRIDPAQSINVTAITGTSMDINYTLADRVQIGRIELRDLPIAFAESELFRQLDLVDRPAMLLGMNALRAFDRVSIDFGNRALRLEIPLRGRPADRQLAWSVPDVSETSLESASVDIGGEHRNPW
ncbi:MAG: hypothetical protein HKN78_03430 [Sphingomonadaceae bacterium]|nr:hypothetical protein [Sphingomonadaceae bacterium]